MQGWAPDFISQADRGRGRGRIMSTRSCRSPATMRCAWRASSRRQEGIFVGISSGATLAAALDDRAPLAARHQHRLHAARHRRALPVDAAVRRHRRGHDGRGARRSRARRRAAASMRRRAGAAGAPAAARCASSCDRRRGALRRRSSCATNPSCCSRSSGASSAGRCASCSRSSASRTAASISIRSRYQADDLGGKIRAVLGAAHRRKDDSADLHRRRARRRLHRPVRRVARRLDAAAAGAERRRLRPDVAIDPYTLLPKWLHPRKTA